IEKRLVQEESHHSAIIHGPDITWQICLLKFIMDECMASFSSNMRELDEHGFFNSPEKTLQERRKIVEDLIVKAQKDRLMIATLAKKLSDFGLFKEYEDEFFRLVQG
ncbi:MAG: hypothetical protein HY610_04905, partial [Elusimicrobia bacterium]|nr:hypothetical protein [Elusimicrobiota bacterium]